MFKYIFLLGMLLLSQIAAASAPVFGSASETRYARQLAPPKGKALVYIYERRQGGGVTPKIWLNNYEIGRIVPGSFSVWQLAPGRLELRVDGTRPVKLSLISQAGKVYLFRLTVSRNDAGVRANIESLPPNYRNELADTRLIKNPRQIAAEVLPPPPSKSVSPQTRATTKPASSEKPKARPRVRAEVAQTSGGMALQLKLGSLSLSKQTQSILGTDRNFDKSASGVYAVEFDYQLQSGLSVGGELLSYKTTYTTVGLNATGDASVLAIMVNAKQYYLTDSTFQPYIGLGIGAATTKVTGAITGNTSGVAYQVLAGLEYRTSAVGIFVEAKYVGANTKSSNNQKIDASGTGVFAGVAFHF